MDKIIFSFKVCILIYILAFIIALMVIGVIVSLRKLSKLWVKE